MRNAQEPDRTPARLKLEHPRLLSALPTRLSRELFAGAEQVQLPAGQALFRAGDPCNGCYRVEDGLLKVVMVSNSGAERILAFLGRGAIVGAISIIDGLPRSATVVAVRDAAVSFVGNAAFEAFAEKHPELYKSWVRLLAERVRETDKMLAATSFLMLKGRMAQTLLRLADHFGQEVAPGRIVIRQKIGQNDLAAMAGIARENLTRVLNDWQRHKVLSRLSGYYCLEDKTQLEHQVKALIPPAQATTALELEGLLCGRRTGTAGRRRTQDGPTVRFREIG